jgi:hypothetical protein
VSINLPHWAAEVLGILGFNWPEIDEDQLREAAAGLRKYAHDCQESHDRTHGVVTGGLREVYAAQSYTALVELWANQTQGHMRTLIDVCGMLADGLEVAATGVEVMKGAVITQLGVAVGELAIDTAAAIFTVGLSEAAAAVEIEAQQRILNGIMQQFESEVVGALVDRLIGPLRDQVDHAVDKLLFEEVAHVAVGGAAPGLKLDTAEMRRHAGTVMNEAEGNLGAGRVLYGKMTSLTFTTGG